MILSHHVNRKGELFFLQVGAFDNVPGDPMFFRIERHGVRGVLVEPQSGAFASLKANYARFPDSQFCLLAAAIAARDGSTISHRRDGSATGFEWRRQIASTRKDVPMRHTYATPHLIRWEVVLCTSSRKLFDWIGRETVDLPVVRTERSDALMLQLFEVPRRLPGVIIFENENLAAPEYADCLEMLRRLGNQIGFSDGSRDGMIAFLEFGGALDAEASFPAFSA
jgi:hypothetical protein